MEPLKKAQVEGFLMFAEPEVLFGNLDELCSVRKIALYLSKFTSFLLFNFYRTGDTFVLQGVSPGSLDPLGRRW